MKAKKYIPNQSEYLATIGIQLAANQEKMFWYNPINQNSLRLSTNGHKYLSSIQKIKSFPVILDNHPIKPRQLLQLERLLKMPYYVGGYKKLWLYDESDYIMIQLHGNNLPQYLNNLQNN